MCMAVVCVGSACIYFEKMIAIPVKLMCLALFFRKNLVRTFDILVRPQSQEVKYLWQSSRKKLASRKEEKRDALIGGYFRVRLPRA